MRCNGFPPIGDSIAELLTDAGHFDRPLPSRLRAYLRLSELRPVLSEEDRFRLGVVRADLAAALHRSGPITVAGISYRAEGNKVVCSLPFGTGAGEGGGLR